MNFELFENSVTKKLFAYKLYIYIYIYIYIYNRIWYWITHKGWYAIKHNQTKQFYGLKLLFLFNNDNLFAYSFMVSSILI